MLTIKLELELKFILPKIFLQTIIVRKKFFKPFFNYNNTYTNIKFLWLMVNFFFLFSYNSLKLLDCIIVSWNKNWVNVWVVDSILFGLMTADMIMIINNNNNNLKKKVKLEKN